MNIWETIQHIINDNHVSNKDLVNAQASLSKRYREGAYNGSPLNEWERYAYVLARLPATAQVIKATYDEILETYPDFSPHSMLDVGAGPGAASLVASDTFDIKQYTLAEADEGWITLGKQLAAKHPLLSQAEWQQKNLVEDSNFKPADLVVASYVFQELPEVAHQPLLSKLFEISNNVLVIIEPGTPRGFSNIHRFRTHLISKGAHIVAPCAHAQTCPMIAPSWCHFSARVVRSHTHRQLKEASLPFEDEKYSYLIVSKDPVAPYRGRVVNMPKKRKGHMIVDVCEDGVINNHIISRKNALYPQAKKLTWGSRFKVF